TGHGISSTPDEVRGEIWRQPSQSQVQQEPVVHLLLEGQVGWERGISGLPVSAASQPSQPAYGGRAEADPGYAPPQSKPGHGGTVAPAAETRLYPPPGEPGPDDAQAGAGYWG